MATDARRLEPDVVLAGRAFDKIADAEPLGVDTLVGVDTLGETRGRAQP